MAGYSLEDRLSDFEEEISELKISLEESENKYIQAVVERDIALGDLSDIRSIVKKYV